jgi:hypothetical protein
MHGVAAAAAVVSVALQFDAALAHDSYIHPHGPSSGSSSVDVDDVAQALADKLLLLRSPHGAGGAAGCTVDGQWWDGKDTLVSMATAGPIGPTRLRLAEGVNDVLPVEANCNGGATPCAWVWAVSGRCLAEGTRVRTWYG